MTELAAPVSEAFAKDEIGVGHALLLARLQPAEQEEALAACYQEQYTNGATKRVLLPVRHLQQWINHNILLELTVAPFSKEDAALLTEAGACVDCPKRTGHNVLLFDGLAAQHDSCSDPKCYAAKVDAHVLRDAAEFYKVDVAAILAQIKQEFATKEKAKAAKKAARRAAA